MKALFPGTFDPPTLGHVDVIRRASLLCKTLVVAIPQDHEKSSLLFSVDERLEMLRNLCKNLFNVRVEVFSGLVVDYCKLHQIGLIVRGLRGCADLDFEFQMARANRAMSGVETLFLASDPALGHISSTLIREIARSAKHLEGFLPEEILDRVYARSLGI